MQFEALTMKVSEAMRKGAALLPRDPEGGAFFRLNAEGGLCGCAMGQAMIGAGAISLENATSLVDQERRLTSDGRPDFRDRTWRVNLLAEHYVPEHWKFSEEALRPPTRGALLRFVANLNDFKHYSAQVIADILEARGY